MKSRQTLVSQSDTEILALFRQDKQAAFRHFYNKYWSPLLRVATTYLDDGAACQDIVQELLIRFYHGEYYLKIKMALSPYLYAALRNRILNHIRRQNVYQKHLLTYAAGKGVQVNEAEARMDRSDIEKALHAAVRTFPQKYQELYVLKYNHELTLKRISSLLDRPVDTVEKQSRKVRGMLRSRLTLANAI